MTRDHQRVPLSTDRILQAAIDVADREGLQALTMRRLGAELGVEAMAMYKHVSGKDDILDGMVELVVSLIEAPGHGMDWRDAMRRRARSARDVLTRHSWRLACSTRDGRWGQTSCDTLTPSWAACGRRASRSMTQPTPFHSSTATSTDTSFRR